ncbi:hypothetical protein [Senegalia massiliensis]|uniref:Uncharacterized protein n=1 Tax=Senegalia massiliensis TaxID=1720316 RepID=A0A845QT97_9CLOT|nr:hypothetical protein [Senegalia massiliensis]NBI05765.1 hypothetical protein [Senegalia massiliensis]
MIETTLRQDLFDTRITDLVGNRIFNHTVSDTTQAPYIQYAVYDERASFYDEGNEIFENNKIQIDIYSKGNYLNIKNTLKKVLREKGYMNLNGGAMYEDEYKLYRYILRCEKEMEI